MTDSVPPAAPAAKEQDPDVEFIYSLTLDEMRQVLSYLAGYNPQGFKQFVLITDQFRTLPPVTAPGADPE